ncbi:MAG: DinB family protein [Vicinamibacterales bacterium]
MQLQAILRGAHAYLSPSASLAALSTEHAARRADNGGHSIAEIVAHMAFWQDWFLDRCDGIATPIPAPAASGWPAVQDGDWGAVLERFEHGFARALALADDQARTDRPVAPPIEFGHLSKYTIADAITHVALHNAHHVGQVITLRQQFGTWPPPAGSWTW